MFYFHTKSLDQICYLNHSKTNDFTKFDRIRWLRPLASMGLSVGKKNEQFESQISQWRLILE